jgi:hypothetical protein
MYKGQEKEELLRLLDAKLTTFDLRKIKNCAVLMDIAGLISAMALTARQFLGIGGAQIR